MMKQLAVTIQRSGAQMMTTAQLIMEVRSYKVAAIKFMSTLNSRSNIAYLLNSFFQAYPFGDQRVFSDQMTNAHSLTPFPNAVVFDWATIFVLGFGNLAALE